MSCRGVRLKSITAALDADVMVISLFEKRILARAVSQATRSEARLCMSVARIGRCFWLKTILTTTLYAAQRANQESASTAATASIGYVTQQGRAHYK